MPMVIILNKDMIQQIKMENELNEKYAPLWKSKNKRVEVHTPWRSNPMIYYNDDLTEEPYYRLYLKIYGTRFVLKKIRPMKGFEEKDYEERFMKLNPPK